MLGRNIAQNLARHATFLRNHRDVIAAMDFFVVPTVRFRLMYVWIAIDHGRLRTLHSNDESHGAVKARGRTESRKDG